MEQDETNWIRILDFHAKLKEILTKTDPSSWPSANWIYSELTKALYGNDPEVLEDIGENQLD